MNAGVYDEATAWRDWLQRAVAGNPADMQIMYGIMGERRLMEWEVDWLPGYLDFKPVRIGNAASLQFQLDVYGELMDTFEQARKGGLAPAESAWDVQIELVKHVDEYWSRPDYGIWETRGPPLHFVYSKVMAWVAYDRAIKAVERYGLPGPVDEWRVTRTRIHAEICEHGFDAARNTFRSAYGETTLDASLLLMAQVGFIAPKDPRYIGTIEAIERELLVDGFVKRYNTHETDDGLRAGRRCVPGLQLLAGRRLCFGRPAGRCRKDAQAAAVDPQRSRIAGRGIRHGEQPPDRQLSAGLLACRPDQQLLQPDPRPPPRRTARQGQRFRRSHAARTQEAAASRQGPRKNGRAGRPPRQASSAFRKSSLTALGLALPPVDFMTWPTNQPNRVGLAL